MRSEVYEDSLDPETELLAPGEPTAEAWPSLPLQKTGRNAIVTLRTVVLENRYLRAVISPDLGGALLGLHDRRTERDVLALPSAVSMAQGGRRGLRLAHGGVWTTGPHERLTETGRVDYRVIEADEDGDAAIFLHETLLGEAASVTACYTLPPDQACLRLELRMANQTSLPLALFTGWRLSFAIDRDWFVKDGCAVYNSSGDAGLVLAGEGLVAFPGVDHVAVTRRGPEQPYLAPGEAETWRLTLTPFGGMGGAEAAGPSAALRLDQERFALQVTKPVAGGRIWIRLANGEAMDAPAQIAPETPFQAEVAGFPSPPVAVVLEDAEKNVLLSYVAGEEGVAWLPSVRPSASLAALADPPAGSEEQVFLDAVRAGEPVPDVSTPLLRVEMHRERAAHAFRDRRWGDANRHLQDGLAVRSSDLGLWWLKAVVARHSGQEEDDSLAFAHQIDPMDPRLRAESFLRTPISEGHDASPLLRPLAANPDAALFVVEELYRVGMEEDAARFIDELQRHVYVPLLAYRLAARYLSNTRMEAEAAGLVTRAEKEPVAPPFPWRPGEVEAVRALAQRFSEAKRLGQVAKLAEAMNPNGTSG